ncbi:MAG: hypothetical protein F4X11_07790 [Acidobacteria bacterium]|nr:hypothetical protein [Acidobacteriota bacterium]
MPLYVVVVPTEYTERVERQIDASNRAEIAPGAWFTYSDHTSAKDFSDWLGMDKENSVRGAVVTANYYSGFGDNALVEKLEALKAKL